MKLTLSPSTGKISPSFKIENSNFPAVPYLSVVQVIPSSTLGIKVLPVAPGVSCLTIYSFISALFKSYHLSCYNIYKIWKLI